MKKMLFSLTIMALSLTFSNCNEATKNTQESPKLEIAARNKATFIKVNALYNEKKLDEAAMFYAPNFERKSEKGGLGHGDAKARWEETYKMWPDNQAIIEQIIAEGDWVMLRAKAVATHTQTVMGVKSTNKKVIVSFWEAIRFNKDGLIEESWSLLDNAAVMQQLGLLPTPK